MGKAREKNREIRRRKILKYSVPWDLAKLVGERREKVKERVREREERLHAL